MLAQNVSAWNTAMKMIREGLRPPIVHAATGLCRNRLRSLYRAMHGKPASQGRISEYAHNRLKTRSQVIEGTAFYQTYYRLGGEKIFRTLDHNLVIDAYRAYKAIAPKGIDATTAWYIARDLREKILAPRRCQTCGGTYLHDPRSELMSCCPICGG
ncbi:MAG: hypothetical protein JRI50_10045 [Deltaproteobacteria bacterium]|nr:hypothetical protein [Deltaproteobacteria bacterium]